MNTEARLREVAAEASGRSMKGIGLDDDLVLKLGLDSLGGLRLLAVVEKRFGVRFRDEELHSYRTLRRILGVIEGGRGGEKP